jgi:hypothetical protein
VAVALKTIVPDSEQAVLRFLADAFQIKPEAQDAKKPLTTWKYYGSHPFWSENRGYILDKDGAIAAFGTITPIRYALEHKEISSLQVIDWAGSREVPGSGLLLYRSLLSRTDTLLAIGGSEDTLRLIPTVKWFRPVKPMRLYARPVRPFVQAGQGSFNGRSIARLARNWMWSLHPALPNTGEWSLRPIDRFDETTPASGDFIPLVRSADWLNYLLRCPAASMSAFALECSARRRGHLLVSRNRRQATLVDLCLSGTDQDWIQATAAVVGWLRRDSSVAEIVAGSNLPLPCAALESCGFRLRGSWPVYVADPKKLLPADSLPEVNLSIGDAFYLRDIDYPFWT